MCFSATASFLTSGVLLALGVHSIRKARVVDPDYLAIAALPLLFGVQQAIEGLLWLSLDGNAAIDAPTVALAYLAFAYVLWPFFVPLAAWRIEKQGRRWGFLLIGFVGLAFGSLLYGPLLFAVDGLQVRLVNHSIVYETASFFDGFLPRYAGRVIYALLVMAPLVLCSIKSIRLFGLVVLASLVVSALVFEYAFVSIWCFFAALISVGILYLLRDVSGGEGQGGKGLDSTSTVPSGGRAPR